MLPRLAAAVRASLETVASSKPALAAAPGNLVDEHRSGNAAAARSRDAVAQSDVVGHDHLLDRNAFASRQLGRHAEVQPVAGIVLYDEDRSGWPGSAADGGENGIDARRGKHLACRGRGEHARADIAGMGRLVSRAAP